MVINSRNLYFIINIILNFRRRESRYGKLFFLGPLPDFARRTGPDRFQRHFQRDSSGG